MAGTENKDGFSCAEPGLDLDRSPEKWNSLRGSSGSSSLGDNRLPRTVHLSQHTQALGAQKDKEDDSSATVLLVPSQQGSWKQ